MIQIDMEMSKDCDGCPLCHRAFDGNETRLACYGLGVWCLGDEGRLDNCPLHEVTADTETISRQQAVDAIAETIVDGESLGYALAEDIMSALPPSPSRPQTCEYCHEDSDGYVRPIEKNGHAFVRNGMNGWTLSLKANGWHGEASIKFCPMCGRKL